MDNADCQSKKDGIEDKAYPHGNQLADLGENAVQHHADGKHMQNAKVDDGVLTDGKVGYNGDQVSNEKELGASFNVGMAQIGRNTGNEDKQSGKIRLSRREEIQQCQSPVPVEEIADGIEGMVEYHAENGKAAQLVQKMNSRL